MKKGLRRYAHHRHDSLDSFSEKHRPDEEGIATQTLLLVIACQSFCEKHRPDEEGISSQKQQVKLHELHRES